MIEFFNRVSGKVEYVIRKIKWRSKILKFRKGESKFGR